MTSNYDFKIYLEGELVHWPPISKGESNLDIRENKKT